MVANNSTSKRKEILGWLISCVAGVVVAVLTLQLPIQMSLPVPLWLTFPFLSLLLAIAIIPIVNTHWWHHNYPNVSLFLGAFVACLYGLGYEDGIHKLIHSAHEYISFIALIGGLFFVSNCVKLDVSGIAGPKVNTAFLAFGALLSNILGTTGASMLLIRPFLKLNQGRAQPLHMVFFIIIISNCGGSLTPIGDPPLYLGYLKGVPFSWTLINLFHSWLFVIGSLLLIYFLFDKFAVAKSNQKESKKIKIEISGINGIFSLFLMVAAIFIDPVLNKSFGISGIPASAIAQIVIAATCFLKTPKAIKYFNEFTFEPFKEVSLIFAGIFATMIPALDYLSTHGASLGLDNPKSFYYGTGLLSAFLDNAPTYLNFLQVAVGPTEINKVSILKLLSSDTGNHELIAISTAAVFFGALTYIGNGPNFMVRSITQSVGLKPPSFFGYFGWALLILGPVLILHSFLFI